MTINVFMAPDLTTEMQPLLDAMKNALEGKIQTENSTTRTALSGVKNDVAEVQTDVESLTTVNGQISTDVQAINQHTDSALGALAFSPIKNIYRGVKAAINQHMDTAFRVVRDIPVVLRSQWVSGTVTIRGRGRILALYYSSNTDLNVLTSFTNLTVDGVVIGNGGHYAYAGLSQKDVSIPFNESFSVKASAGSRYVLYELYE